MTDAHPPDREEQLEEVRQALLDLRREIEERFARRSTEETEGQDWIGLFDGLRRRLATLGMAERSDRVDEFGMDEVALRRAIPLLDFLQDRYWRTEVSGLGNLPVSGGCLLVSNRSGLLPYDGLLLSHIVSRWHPDAVRPRFLVADWLITLPFVQPFLARLGGVRACRENAERLLANGSWVIAFPEGVKGAAKVFRERYRLQRFGRGGVVRVALECGVPLVPAAVVGAEEVHPILFKVTAPARALGLPFLPVTPTFPALGPLGTLPLPSKWRVEFGEPLDIEPHGPEGANDELLVARLTAELRTRIQEMIDRVVKSRPSVWG